MMGEIRNPVRWGDIESDMTEAEEQLAECLARGDKCALGVSTPQEAAPHNLVRSEVIRFFAYGGDGEHQVGGGTIELQGAWISGGTLDLTNARVSYALHFTRCHFDTCVELVNAECAALSMEGSHLAHGLICDGLRVKGGVFLRRSNGTPGKIPHQDFSAAGIVRFVGARIGRDLDCTGGNFRIPKGDPEGIAFGIDRAKIEGSLLLNGGFSAMGEARLPGAKIGGNLDCMGGTFNSQGEAALRADHAKIEGDAYLCNKFRAMGRVDFTDAKIGGGLNCMGGTFDGQGETALCANRAKIEGDADLGDKFHAMGGVDFRSAKIGGDLRCSGGAFEMGINAMQMEVGEALLWNSVSGGRDVSWVNLEGARVSVLADGDVEWGNFTLLLDGFTYNYIPDHRHVQPRINWLSKRPSFRPFSPLPYEQAAKVLRSMGKDIDAWDIEREKRRLEREERDSQNALKVPLWRRLWGRGIDALTDFVYRPWKTLISTILIVVVGAGLFGFADESGRIVPHQPAALASVKYQYGRVPAETPGETVARKFSGYP